MKEYKEKYGTSLFCLEGIEVWGISKGYIMKKFRYEGGERYIFKEILSST